MKAIGIDIGTTTICGIVIDSVSGDVLDVKTLPNDSMVNGAAWERLQDPERILQIVLSIYHGFLEQFTDICSIGLTGQMHGILYTDQNGLSVSPLYTWQDESGNEPVSAQFSYAQKLSDLTGYPMSSGFGMTTHYVLSCTGKVPADARFFCTIPDYIGMRLTEISVPVLTPSMAASLGCFQLDLLTFDLKACRQADIPDHCLPACQNGFILLGKTPEGIPVSAALGDNQASVIGSVRSMSDSVLINIGTGSQVSSGIEHYLPVNGIELRPLTGNDYILVGSSLCGGRAYAALEQFFRQTVTDMTGETSSPLYGAMDRLLDRYSSLPDPSLKEQLSQSSLPVANTRFCGTRQDPSLTGSITNLTLDNLTPASLTYAILCGIAEELITYHRQMLDAGVKKPLHLIGSGNGLRMNRHLRKIFEDIYQLEMQIPEHKEEAAYGSALYSLCAIKEKESLAQAQTLIHYC